MTAVVPVDLWFIPLGDARIDERVEVLSAEERTRADRFVSEEIGVRFRRGRAALRTILANQIDVDPTEIEFEYGDQGKPGITNADLSFNLSHSGDIATLAITEKRCAIGADVELLAPERPFDDLAGRWFAPEEAEGFRGLAPRSKPQAFYRLWTLKESFLKAHGGGLTVPLNAFAFDPDPSADSALRRDDVSEGRTWSFDRFELREGAIGAVCVEGAAIRIRRRDFIER